MPRHRAAGVAFQMPASTCLHRLGRFGRRHRRLCGPVAALPAGFGRAAAPGLPRLGRQSRAGDRAPLDDRPASAANRSGLPEFAVSKAALGALGYVLRWSIRNRAARQCLDRAGRALVSCFPHETRFLSVNKTVAQRKRHRKRGGGKEESGTWECGTRTETGPGGAKDRC